ncbi:hypothetical protein F5877DRAFT_73454 [Lentinula edodes]|nr:hypothetical protein F5877DRAFT_73454 [Lentinula edodes]
MFYEEMPPRSEKPSDLFHISKRHSASFRRKMQQNEPGRSSGLQVPPKEDRDNPLAAHISMKRSLDSSASGSPQTKPYFNLDIIEPKTPLTSAKISKMLHRVRTSKITVDKANEVEIAAYDKQVGETHAEKGIYGERTWVTAGAGHPKSADLNVPLSFGAAPPGGFGPQGSMGDGIPQQPSEGIEAWLAVEPASAILLHSNFGRQGAMRKRKGEHEMNGHKFVQKQFYQLMFCTFCSDFLLNATDYQRKDCRYTCHKKCHEKVVTKCISKSNTGVSALSLNSGDAIVLFTEIMYQVNVHQEGERRWVSERIRVGGCGRETQELPGTSTERLRRTLVDAVLEGTGKSKKYRITCPFEDSKIQITPFYDDEEKINHHIPHRFKPLTNIGAT